MGSAIFSRIKNWTSTENLTNEDLNAEIDNILTNFNTLGMDDYSTSVAQMQLTVNPGEVGTESLATTLGGELERLRFSIQEIKGDVTQWYTAGATSLSEVAAVLGTSLDGNRIASGLSRADSTQGVYLVPNGSAATFKVDGDTTNLNYFVNGTSVTISTEVSVTGVSTAPSSQNTALVNDTDVADGEETKLLGEYGTTLTMDAAGTGITALVGKLAAFKINNGADDEYFLALVKSATELTEIRRGFFFDSSSAPVPRIAIADNDTITLLRITWVFGKDDGTIVTTTSEPVWSAVEPGSPASDDYWFDMANNTWKVYSGGSFGSADATFLGIVASDSSNCIAGRCLEFSGTSIDTQTVQLERSSATVIRGILNRPGAGIHTSRKTYGYDSPEWDITTDLESGLTEASSTQYYLYLDGDGKEIISDKVPYDREGDLGGYYHPHHVWRCVGQVYNDSSSDLGEPDNFNDLKLVFPTINGYFTSINSLDTPYTVLKTQENIFIDAVSDDMAVTLPPSRGLAGHRVILSKTDNNRTNPFNFVDGDVTTGTDTIGLTAHEFSDLHKVRLTTTTTLPAGLATATDYWVIYVDANNIKLASTRANAVADTAVDITAAASGGTHTVLNEERTITISADGSETISGESSVVLEREKQLLSVVCDGSNWHIIEWTNGQSQVIVRDVNGYGSTGTKVPRFQKTVVDEGNDITYADSSTDGNSMTLNRDGTYSMYAVYTDSGGSRNYGFTVNQTDALTTNIGSVEGFEAVIIGNNGGLNDVRGSVAATRRFKAGDVIRFVTDGAILKGDDEDVKFGIVRQGD